MTKVLLYPGRNYAMLPGMKVLARLIPFLFLAYALYLLPPRVDWAVVFYPALHAPDPYAVQGFFNPPWLLWLLWPFSLLPSHVAGSLWLAGMAAGVVYAAARLGADRWSYLCIILSAPFVWFITLGNIDVLILLALFVAHPAASVLLLAIKPHVLGTALLFKAREMRPRDLAIVAAVFAVSLLLYGLWPLDLWRILATSGVGHPFSLDVWPWGIPAGLALLAYAWRKGDAVLGGLSTYFLTPYISPSSMIVYAVIVFARLRGWQRVAAYAAMTAVTVVLYG